MLGEGWVTFPWESIGGFLPPRPIVLIFPTLYIVTSVCISVYISKSPLKRMYHHNTIITLKNINSNSLISWNSQLVITFQGSFKWAGTWPDLPPYHQSWPLPRFLSIAEEGQKDDVFLHLQANPND